MLNIFWGLLTQLSLMQVWDVASGTCVHTLRGHNDEILDVGFNTTGSKLVTASADGNSRVYNTMTGACQAVLAGHEGEISKVAFNPQGSRILTASSDKTGIFHHSFLLFLFDLFWFVSSSNLGDRNWRLFASLRRTHG